VIVDKTLQLKDSNSDGQQVYQCQKNEQLPPFSNSKIPRHTMYGDGNPDSG